MNDEHASGPRESAVTAMRTMLELQRVTEKAATRAEATADLANKNASDVRERVASLEGAVNDIKTAQSQILLKLGQLTERSPLERFVFGWFALAAGSWFTVELIKGLLR